MRKLLCRCVVLAAIVLPGAIRAEGGGAVLLRDGESTLSLAAGERGAEQLRLRSRVINVKRIFALEAPARIVIDLRKPRFKSSHELLPQSRFLAALRIGKHLRYARLVLDVKGEEVPEYSWQQRGDILLLTLGAASKAAEPSPAPAEATAAPQQESGEAQPHYQPAHPSPTPSAAASAPAQPTPTPAPPRHRTTPTPQPTARAAPSPTDAEGAGSTGAEAPLQLQGITFAYQEPGRQPLLRLELTGRSKFTLIQKDARHYQIIIPHCSIRWRRLELPHFAPHDFKGFTVVMTEQEGSALKVVIGVERGVTLRALPLGTEVLVRAAEM